MDEDGKQWKRLYDSAANRIMNLEQIIEEKNVALSNLSNNLANAQKAVDINKTMVRNGLTEFNRKEQEYIEILNKMRAKLKELGYGDFDKLGN